MMLLSRFWYAVVAMVAGALAAFAFALVAFYNDRAQQASLVQLAADSQAVEWAIKIESRRRIDALLPLAVDADLWRAAVPLAAPQEEPVAKINSARLEVKKALKKTVAPLKEGNRVAYAPDVVFLVGRAGEVFASERVADGNKKGRLPAWLEAIDQNDEFELGGYFAVVDALSGYERDDLWLIGDHLFLVSARPAMSVPVGGPTAGSTGLPPAGAIVGLKLLDDEFAKTLATSTRTSLVLFARSRRVSAGADVTRDPTELDAVGDELSRLARDPAFAGKSRTEPRLISGGVGATFVRLAGEAPLAGFAVVRHSDFLGSPLDAQGRFTADHKQHLPLLWIGGGALLALLVGIGLSALEHGLPLRAFRKQASSLKTGDIEYLQPEKLRGPYREAASAINDGFERMLIKRGGQGSRPADLSAILGPVPAQGQLAAFNLPSEPPPAPARLSSPAPPVPRASTPPPIPSSPAGPLGRKAPPPRPPAIAALDDDEKTSVGLPNEAVHQGSGARGNGTLGQTGPVNEEGEWLSVYEEFLRIKRQCNEQTEGMTFAKFSNTLRKNRDALVLRHHCKTVKFSVYVKDGRAQLKASPVRDA